MTFHPLLLLLLLGHIIGDFYAQTDNMSKGKRSSECCERWKWLVCHGLCYTLAMAVVLFPVIRFSWGLLLLFLMVSVSHMALDSVKQFIKWKPFIVDQLMHIGFIVLAWRIWNNRMIMWPYVSELNSMIFPRMSMLHENPYWTLLGVLVILRPVGYLIKSNEIWNFGDIVEAERDETEPNKVMPNAGRMIGYLERLIVFFLMINSLLWVYRE